VRNLDDRQSHIAVIRQSILNDVLRPEHQDVFWMDSDISDFDVSVIEKMREYENAIIAPMVLWESRNEVLFYDLAGFIEDGRWARQHHPYFNQKGDVVELDSVGAFYKVPAEVYRAGAFYYPVAGYVEHYSICEFARRRMGMKVLCDTRLKVFHIDLTYYGEIHKV
jgi:hypothetical protein